MKQDYSQFLASKAIRAKEHGLARVPDLAPHLFSFQRTCVEHHLRTGAAGCFLDTGLGKTEVQLEFCQNGIELKESYWRQACRYLDAECFGLKSVLDFRRQE